MSDITKCLATDCPIKHSCRRFTCTTSAYQSWFVNMPCEWYGDWFFCEYWLDNKPLKKYTLEQAKQIVNVET